MTFKIYEARIQSPANCQTILKTIKKSANNNNKKISTKRNKRANTHIKRCKGYLLVKICEKN